MKRLFPLILCTALLAACNGAPETAADAPVSPSPAQTTTYEPMKIFGGFTTTAWRGEGTDPAGKPVVDIATYKYILGGRALQSTHRLEDGSYGGRTIYFYDEGQKKYIYHYFTTAGFHTVGEVTPNDNGFIAIEKAIGHPTVDEVRSNMTVKEDEIRVVTEMINKDGTSQSHEGFVYTPYRLTSELFDEYE